MPGSEYYDDYFDRDYEQNRKWKEDSLEKKIRSLTIEIRNGIEMRGLDRVLAEIVCGKIQK